MYLKAPSCSFFLFLRIAPPPAGHAATGTLASLDCLQSHRGGQNPRTEPEKKLYVSTPWKFNSEFTPEKLPASKHHFSGGELLNFGGVIAALAAPSQRDVNGVCVGIRSAIQFLDGVLGE